ncbi:SMI1/KNR4 family protein [Bacteroides thetaiotaomicron]|uniref:SMI1/KNR4 family protein n=1 Tax=Bacteroides thetaiotaomicron TaxID=818 RepID=UPI0039B46BA9
MDYKKILKKKRVNCLGGVSPLIIKDAEEKLNLHFPPEYNKFLQECGTLNIADSYIYGLYSNYDNLCTAGSIIYETLKCRKEYKLPNEYIVLENLDDEVLYILLTTYKEDKNNGQIYSIEINYDDNTLTSPNLIYNSFNEYVEDFIQQ